VGREAVPPPPYAVHSLGTREFTHMTTSSIPDNGIVLTVQELMRALQEAGYTIDLIDQQCERLQWLINEARGAQLDALAARSVLLDYITAADRFLTD
jgi:hypothetical protein